MMHFGIVFRAIYESYKDMFCFWEATLLLRKLATVVVSEGPFP